MGKRSGVPHRDDELEKLTRGELEGELARARSRLRIPASAAAAKQWRKRVHWLEAAVAQRD